MRKKMLVAVLLCGVLLVAVVAAWATRDTRPIPPSGVRCFTTTIRLPVRPADRTGWSKPGFQVTQAAKLKSGEIIAPVLRVMRPNFRGFMGGVRVDPIWEATYHSLGEGQAKLDIAVDEDIDQYIILVRRVPTAERRGDDPWRVWTFGPEDITNEIVMPGFDAMEPLSTRQDAADLLEKDRIARAFASELQS